jgi:uncharacterized protein YjdB
MGAMSVKRFSAIAIVCAALASCSPGSDGPTGGDTITVVVTPANPKVQVGFTVQLSAVVNGPPGIPQDVVWESRSLEIATVDGDGTVEGLTEGEGIIRVKWASNFLEFTDVSVTVTTTPVGEGRAALKVVAR